MPEHITSKQSIIYSKHLVVWSIKNYMQLIAKNDHQIFSPEFPLVKNNLIWKLNVDKQRDIYLYPLQNSGKFYISIELFHRDRKIENLNSIVESNRAWYNIFKNLSNTLNNKLLPNDTLTIVCNIRWARKEMEMHDLKLNENKHLELLTNETFADLTIIVGRQTIRAHRSILATRSDYFKNILSGNDVVIEIKDIDADIFRIILKYIYIGGVAAADIIAIEKNAKQLFMAADKLKMGLLQLICERELSETISFETAIDIYMLAERYSRKELMAIAMDFIIVHFYFVSLTASWQNLMKTNVDLVLEIFTQKFRRCNCF